MESEREKERLAVKDILDIYSDKLDVRLLSRLYDVQREGIEAHADDMMLVRVSGKHDRSFVGKFEEELSCSRILEMIPESRYTYFKLLD